MSVGDRRGTEQGGSRACGPSEVREIAFLPVTGSRDAPTKCNAANTSNRAWRAAASSSTPMSSACSRPHRLTLNSRVTHTWTRLQSVSSPRRALAEPGTRFPWPTGFGRALWLSCRIRTPPSRSGLVTRFSALWRCGARSHWPLTVDEANRLQLLPRPSHMCSLENTAEEEKIRAELEAQRSRSELAHVSRQRSMGELTASLAHELNQPLTGILGNAQAARRMLAVTPALDIKELKEILDDIVDDERRASETIQRIQKWLQKGGLETVAARSQFGYSRSGDPAQERRVIRNLRLDLQLCQMPPVVRGDSVGAASTDPESAAQRDGCVSSLNPADRTIVVSIFATAGGSVHVAVQDFGSGVPVEVGRPSSSSRSYTTKANGMGMGLSISRSIVEAHRGRSGCHATRIAERDSNSFFRATRRRNHESQNTSLPWSTTIPR